MGDTNIDSLSIQIEANSVSAEKALNSLVDTLGNLQTALGKTYNTSGSGKLVSSFTRSNNSMKNMFATSKSINQSVKNMFNNFIRMAFSIHTAKAAFDGLKKSVTETSNYIETLNFFDVSFEKISSEWADEWEKYGYESAEAYAESFKERTNQTLKQLSGIESDYDAGLISDTGLKNLGLNIQEVTKYAAQLASVTNSIGLTGEASVVASNTFTKLAGDLSSLFNVDYSKASANLQSGLIGQSRALYQYGIDITNATLQTYAYELGLEKAVSEMTQAEKMQLRMIAILDQSRVSWGNLANTINSPSNMLRQFTTNLKELSLVFGQLFLPILTKVLPVLNGITIAFKNLLVSTAKIFGINIDLSGFGQGYSDISESLDTGADYSGEMSDNIGSANTNANKLKKTLSTLSFDELNKLSSPDTNAASSSGLSSSGSAPAVDLTDEIISLSNEYNKAFEEAYKQMESNAQEIANRITRILEPVKEIIYYISIGAWEDAGSKLSKTVSGALDSIKWEEVYEKARNFGTGFADFLNGLITPELFGELGDTVAGAINTSLTSWFAFGSTYDWANLGHSIGSFINRVFSGIDWGLAGETLNTWANGLLDSMLIALEDITWEDIGADISEFLKEIEWESLLLKVGEVIWESISGALEISDYLFDSGSIEDKIVGALLALKFTGIGFSFAKIVWDKISSSLLGNLVTTLFKSKIKKGVSDVITESISGAAGAAEVTGTTGTGTSFGAKALGLFKDLLKEPTLGLGAVIIGIVEISSELAKFIEVIQGGNGELTSMGGALHDLAGKLENSKQLTTEQKEELDALIESEESANSTSTQIAQAALEKLKEFGVSTSEFESLLSQASTQATMTSEDIGILSDNVSMLGDGFSESSKLLNLSAIDTREAFKGMNDVLVQLWNDGELADDAFYALSESLSATKASLDITKDSTGGAQTALDSLMSIMEEFDVPASLFISLLGEKFPEAIENTSLSTDGVVEALGNVGESAKNVATNFGEKLFGAVDTLGEKMGLSADSTEGLDDKLDLFSEAKSWMKALGFSVLSNAISSIKESGDDAKEGLETLETSTNDFITNTAGMEESFRSIAEDIGIQFPEGMKDAIDNGMPLIDSSVLRMIDIMKGNVENGLQIHSPSKVAYGYGENYIQGLINGINSLRNDLFGNIYSIVESMSGAFNNLSDVMYSQGRNAAQSYANGMRSVYIPTPHMRISDWRTHNLGNGGYMQSPVFEVNWYKTGGFVDGELWGMNEHGNPEMVGKVGNKTAVANNTIIAEAIKGAVVEGMSEVMMNSSGNSQSPIFEIVVKTESDEVLARAVTRGQKKLDYRMNATPAFGY